MDRTQANFPKGRFHYTIGEISDIDADFCQVNGRIGSVQQYEIILGKSAPFLVKSFKTETRYGKNIITEIHNLNVLDEIFKKDIINAVAEYYKLDESNDLTVTIDDTTYKGKVLSIVNNNNDLYCFNLWLSENLYDCQLYLWRNTALSPNPRYNLFCGDTEYRHIKVEDKLDKLLEITGIISKRKANPRIPAKFDFKVEPSKIKKPINIIPDLPIVNCRTVDEPNEAANRLNKELELINKWDRKFKVNDFINLELDIEYNAEYQHYKTSAHFSGLASPTIEHRAHKIGNCKEIMGRIIDLHARFPEEDAGVRKAIYQILHKLYHSESLFQKAVINKVQDIMSVLE